VATSARYFAAQEATAAGELWRLTDTVGGLRASVAPFAGAEIAGVQKRIGNEWLELLHRGEHFAPCGSWQGRAPWLFPAVGRSYSPHALAEALRTGKRPADFDWVQGRTIFPMPIHGFAMSRPWKAQRAAADESSAVVECELCDDAATRSFYPFGFTLRMTAQISDGKLQTTVRVHAARDNDAPMPFCLGNHISVRAPLTGNRQFEEVKILAATDAVKSPTPLGLAGARSTLPLRKEMTLADARLHSLIVGPFAPDNASVKMIDPSGLSLEVTQREVDGGSKKAPADAFHFVFWSVPEENFFCPEPWLGLPNALNTKRGAVLLCAGDSFTWEMTVRVAQSAGPK
jgi:galactose mutarotase-like enzyme